jgi:hypothetical protein
MSLFVEDNLGVFIVLTLILGGGAAFMSGRALARGWKPVWQVIAYMIPFTAGLRFLHYALFQTDLASVHYFLTDGILMTAIALISHRLTRTSQMVNQYPWLYERSGPFSWKGRT